MTSVTNRTSTSSTKTRPSTVGRKLKTFRKVRGYTQEYAGFLLGLSRGQVSSLETGYVVPSRALSRRITSDIEYYSGF